MTTTSFHYYAFDAAQLLVNCIEHLQDVVDLDTHGSHSILYEIKETLLRTEALLQEYFIQILQSDTDNNINDANETSSEILSRIQSAPQQKVPPSLSECMSALKISMEQQKERDYLSKSPSLEGHHQHHHHHHNRASKSPAKQIRTSTSSGSLHRSYSPSRSVTDTLLFRLIVTLQLCLVRIDDAHFVIAGCRRQSSDGSSTAVMKARRRRRQWLVNMGYCGGVLGVTAFLLHRNRRQDGSTIETRTFIDTLTKVGIVTLLGRMTMIQWKTLWMASKLDKSTAEIEEWQQQWFVVHNRSTKGDSVATTNSGMQQISYDIGEDAGAKLLIDYARQHPPRNKTSSFWISDGELRFLIVRKALEAYYSLTGADDDSKDKSQQLPSHFRDLMQHSWGLVSQPGVKNFSLKASSLMKGASVADRIEIAGVPCFVISKHPCPELAAAIQRFHRKDRRKLSLQLTTIDESQESTPATLDATIPKKLFAGTNDNYRQQDIILHCTGGGFFAHMIAFDLLYLLDWSAATGAVMICPEFLLLPEHTFPTALQEITNVYSTLVSGDAVATLGFEVNNIAVTGESTGGNLAAALCVNLCLDADKDNNNTSNKSGGKEGQDPPSPPKSSSDSEDEYLFPESVGSISNSGSGSGSEEQAESFRSGAVRLPDALMLSCAVLNLSPEITHSRVLGTEDPVLPSGVISAISDAYLPPSLGISKKHLLASPFYAPDSILTRFPPTLLFASSNDPLLDDSVVFNQRLRSLGVESELRAVQNMPHAYWGLGTAGFPEAKQVQTECREWLSHQLARSEE